MDIRVRYRGKDYTAQEIEEIRGIIGAQRERSRRFISQEICRRWNWTQANGSLKDLVCRGLLLHLQTKGLIELPAKKKNPPNPFLNRKSPLPVEVDQSPITGELSELRPIELIAVRRTSMEALYRGLIEQYHYLHYTRPVGEHLEYIAFTHSRPVACFGFCSVPRHIGCRDRYIGWNKEQRVKRIHLLSINTRFLIVPWVAVSNLASHLLGMMARRISDDWERVYNHEIVWLETFVDPSQGFLGTCYKAANWIYLGQTRGLGKNDHTKRVNRSLKLVFGYPVQNKFREVLCD